GGRTAAMSSASATESAGTASKPASRSTTRRARRICVSSSTTRTRRRSATGRPPRHGGCRRLSRVRELDDERRPLPRQRLRVHGAAVELDESLDDRQPEARATAPARPLVGLVERLEDAVELAARDPWPPVDDAQADPSRARAC